MVKAVILKPSAGSRPSIFPAPAVLTDPRSASALARRRARIDREERIAMAALADPDVKTKSLLGTETSLSGTGVGGIYVPSSGERQSPVADHSSPYSTYPLHPPGDDFIRDNLPRMQSLGARSSNGVLSSEQQLRRLLGLLNSELKQRKVVEGDLHDLPKPIRDLLLTKDLYTPLLSSTMDHVDIATSQLGRCFDAKSNTLYRVVVLRDDSGRPLSIGVSKIYLDKLKGSEALDKLRHLLCRTEVPVGAALIATGLAERISTEIKGCYRFPVGGTFADDFVSSVLDLAQKQELGLASTLKSGRPRLIVPDTLYLTRPGFDYVIGRSKDLLLDGEDIGKFFDIPLIGLSEPFLPSHVVREFSSGDVQSIR